MRISSNSLLALACLLISLQLVLAKEDGQAPSVTARKKLPKDPLFITDADLEHLYDEWEEADEDKLPLDELPPHKQPPPKIELPKSGDTSELFKDPEKLMRETKKGKTVMTFVTVTGNPTREQTETITQRWQVGLSNNHIRVERYVISDDRVIFVFQDGLQAFDAKDFILDQPECKEFTIDQRTWQGKGYPVEYPHAKAAAAPKAEAMRDEL